MKFISSRAGSCLSIGVVLLVLAARGSGPRTAFVACADDNAVDSVTALLREKVATLRAIVDQVNQQYETGVGSLDEVFQTTRALRHAELALCTTTEQKIPILEKLLVEAKDMEKYVNTDFTLGKRIETHVLQAKVNRIDAEIALEQAKAGAR